MTTIAAIDPGAAGAIALFCDGELYDLADMPLTRHIGWAHNIPDANAVRAIVEVCDLVVIEVPQPRPGNGMGSVAASLASWGTLLGACHGIGVRLVTPAVWTKALGVGADKTVHRRAADALYPGRDWFSRRKDDGRADAVLIGHWWLTRGKAT